MKQTIELGAYGWRHKHWSNTFYPEDLPLDEDDDWRLSYYSNEFNTVLVPAHYWCKSRAVDCEDWLEAVHENFRFIVQCHESIFENLTTTELTDCLKILQPQLSGLVLLLENPSAKEKFLPVLDALEVELFEPVPVLDSVGQKIWRQDNSLSSLVIVDNDLSDLRLARRLAEDILGQQPEESGKEMAVIINHADLKADNLSKFRSVLEIMGY